MKKLYIYITVCLLSLNYSYSQNKEDLKVIKKIYNYYSDTPRESTDSKKTQKFKYNLIKDYPNSPVIKLVKLLDETNNKDMTSINGRGDILSSIINFHTLPYSYISNKSISVFKDLLINEKSRNDKILNLIVELEKRRDDQFEKDIYTYKFESPYEHFKNILDDIYLDPSEFEEFEINVYDDLIDYISKKIESIRTSLYYDSQSKENEKVNLLKDNFVVKNTDYGRELSIFLFTTKLLDSINIYKNKKKSLDEISLSSRLEYKFSKIENFLYFKNNDNFKSFFRVGHDQFYMKRFLSLQRLSEGKSSEYRIKGEISIENTIQEIRSILSICGYESLLTEIDNTKSSKIVTILRENGYTSPFIDLLDFDFKLTKTLDHLTKDLYKEMYPFMINTFVDEDGVIKPEPEWVKNFKGYSNNYRDWGKVEKRIFEINKGGKLFFPEKTDIYEMDDYKGREHLFKPDRLSQIYTNVFMFSHDYTWDSNRNLTLKNKNELYTEKDMKVFREISQIGEKWNYTSFNLMYKHNDDIKDPAPKNCFSSTHKKTLIKTQLHTNNGSKPIYSQLIEFDLISSSSCSYVWNILYIDRYGGGNQVQFRTTSDFSQKDERIEIELWDSNTQRYMSPVFVKPVY
tara:strand:+ start:1671 stop:3554 length:1884 start_codon:yes stop_codon:yes gene_type:complete